jgi:periplasmic divalent cation tolerance protein
VLRPGDSLPGMSDYLSVTTAAETREAAEALTRSAVRAGLAAGGSVTGPVSSFFMHLGEYGEGREWHAVLKTTRARYPELEAHLLAEHPWQNPEISAVELTGAPAYLEWIRASVE